MNEEHLIDCPVCKGLKVFPVEYIEEKFRGISYLQPCFVCNKTGKVDWIFFIKFSKWATNKDVDQGMMYRKNGKWWLHKGYLVNDPNHIIKWETCYYTKKELEDFIKKINSNMTFKEIRETEKRNMKNLIVYKKALLGIRIGDRYELYGKN